MIRLLYNTKNIMRKFKAFTLIETLIVIAVFCIGILTVLIWLSQTLKNKEYANIQIKSAFFAREWIELMFNLRDANYHKELPWNCIFKYSSDPMVIVLDDHNNETSNSACDGYFTRWTVLKIWIWSNDNEYIHVERWEIKEDDFDDNFENFQIYFHKWVDNWYYYDYIWTDDEKTWFARYLVIDTVDWVDKDDQLLKIESHVLYKKWALTWEKLMETFIWNYEFDQ